MFQSKKLVPFKSVQPRPSGFSEYNDCVVRALANATGMPYTTAHAEAASLGRKNGEGTPWPIVTKLYDRYGKRIQAFEDAGFRNQRYTRRGCVSVSRFVRENPVGTFIAHITGHVFAIRDGVVLDSFPPRGLQRIDYYWKIG